MIIPANHFVKLLCSIVDNDNLDDASFRELVRNSVNESEVEMCDEQNETIQKLQDENTKLRSIICDMLQTIMGERK